MSNGQGGAQGAGEAIFSSVGTATGTGGIAFNISPTSWKRIALVAAVSRAAVVKRMREG